MSSRCVQCTLRRGHRRCRYCGMCSRSCTLNSSKVETFPNWLGGTLIQVVWTRPELLQPRGVIALKRLGIEPCLEGADAIPVKGYCRWWGNRCIYRTLGCMKVVFSPWKVYHEVTGGCVTSQGCWNDRGNGDEPCAGWLWSQYYWRHDIMKERGWRPGFQGISLCRPWHSHRRWWMFLELYKCCDGGCSYQTFDEELFYRFHIRGRSSTYAQPRNGCTGSVLLYQISEHDTRILVDVKQPLPSDLGQTNIQSFFLSLT